MNLRTQLALVGATLSLGLSGCGGGGDPAPPEPTANQLNAGNMLAATGVAMLAQQRVHGDAALLLSSVFTHYIQQSPAATYACSAGGSLTLTQTGPRVWAYTARDCDSGSLLIRSGQIVIDASLPDGHGLKLQFTDTIYRASPPGSNSLQTVNGTLTFLIDVAADLGKRSTGSMTFSSNGRTDIYTDVFIASKRSDERFAQYGVGVASPRFAHPLKLLFEQPANLLTLEAGDGSTVTVTEQNGGARLDLRQTAAAAPVTSLTATSSELESARVRALQ